MPSRNPSAVHSREMKLGDYTEANRRMWNETAAIHADLKLADLLNGFRNPDYNLLDNTERQILTELGVAGKWVAQLSCNNGRELLSVVRLGASGGVGFDISDAFIDQANQLAAAAHLEERVEFVCTDVYDIPTRYNSTFDLVYVTVGALGWLPDLNHYFATVDRLLSPSGHLFVYEMHPILDMFDADGDLAIRHSYFRSEPFESTDDPDYYDPERIVEATSFWFHHKLSDIIGGCLRHGLALRVFEEHDHDISTVFRSLQDLKKRPPLCYTLVAQKDMILP